MTQKSLLESPNIIAAWDWANVIFEAAAISSSGPSRGHRHCWESNQSEGNIALHVYCLHVIFIQEGEKRDRLLDSYHITVAIFLGQPTDRWAIICSGDAVTSLVGLEVSCF